MQVHGEVKSSRTVVVLMPDHSLCCVSIVLLGYTCLTKICGGSGPASRLASVHVGVHMGSDDNHNNIMLIVHS